MAAFLEGLPLIPKACPHPPPPAYEQGKSKPDITRLRRLEGGWRLRREQLIGRGQVAEGAVAGGGGEAGRRGARSSGEYTSDNKVRTLTAYN